MRIRPYIGSDAETLAGIFTRAVTILAAKHYSSEQIAAWAGAAATAEETSARCSDGRLVLVAAERSNPIGFIDLEIDGHIDMLFVAPEWAGQGVASALYAQLQSHAIENAMSRLHVEASEMAKPFFTRKGFTLLHRRDFAMDGTAVYNFAMAKDLRAG